MPLILSRRADLGPLSQVRAGEDFLVTLIRARADHALIRVHEFNGRRKKLLEQKRVPYGDALTCNNARGETISITPRQTTKRRACELILDYPGGQLLREEVHQRKQQERRAYEHNPTSHTE